MRELLPQREFIEVDGRRFVGPFTYELTRALGGMRSTATVYDRDHKSVRSFTAESASKVDDASDVEVTAAALAFIGDLGDVGGRDAPWWSVWWTRFARALARWASLARTVRISSMQIVTMLILVGAGTAFVSVRGEHARVARRVRLLGMESDMRTAVVAALMDLSEPGVTQARLERAVAKSLANAVVKDMTVAVKLRQDSAFDLIGRADNLSCRIVVSIGTGQYEPLTCGADGEPAVRVIGDPAVLRAP